MTDQKKYIQALIDLHSGLKYLGPGDTTFSYDIIQNLPQLPTYPRIADMGCGTGASALLLAIVFGAPVKAVDFSETFLEEMMLHAKEQGIEHLIEPSHGDIGSLDWEHESIDLLWSEGAAYNLTFKGALQAWRPLLKTDGIAVISELNYFSNNPPRKLKEYLLGMYPDINTEDKNRELIQSSGFELISHSRLPTNYWWQNYYGPLSERITTLKEHCDETLQIVINEMEEEMDYFRKYSDYYGYSFFIIRAI